MKQKFNWVEIYRNRNCATFRAMTYKGWLVKNIEYDHTGYSVEASSVVFVEDPHHTWEIAF